MVFPVTAFGASHGFRRRRRLRLLPRRRLSPQPSRSIPLVQSAKEPNTGWAQPARFLVRQMGAMIPLYWVLSIVPTSCFQGVANGQPYTAYRSPLDTQYGSARYRFGL